MEATNKKTEAFLAAIKNLAVQECKKIDDETDALREERLKTLQADARKRYKSYMEYEISRIRAQANREVSDCAAAARKTLAEQRSALSDAVFCDARREIAAFTETDAYRDLLLQSAREMAAVFPEGETELFVREADLAFAEALTAAFGRACRVTACGDITLGGLRAENAAQGCLADDTLDTRLAQQKNRFLEESGLSVEGDAR